MREGRKLLTSPQGEFSVTVDPSGAHICSIIRTDCGTEFLLRTPWADESWGSEFPTGGSGEEWHKRYPGGWHTLIPHAGDARRLNNIDHPFHGEAAWRQWRVSEQHSHACTFEVILRTVPFKVRRRIEVHATGVLVQQYVENLSAQEADFTWTEHPTFSDALVGPRSELSISGERIEADFSRSGFQDPHVPGPGVAELRNPDTGHLARLSWDATLLPYLYVWQEHGNVSEFPWWGSTNTVGLEPASRRYHGDPESLGPLTLGGGASLSSSFLLEFSQLNPCGEPERRSEIETQPKKASEPDGQKRILT